MLETQKDSKYWNSIKKKQGAKEKELMNTYKFLINDFAEWETDFIKKKLKWYLDDDSTDEYKNFVNEVFNMNRIHLKFVNQISANNISIVAERYLKESKFFKKENNNESIMG